MKQHIHLGFEVGTGEPVEIPLKHMVITGQTQEAGKTTALESLIDRSGLRALTFVTKRGEGSFRNSVRIEPYFREQADWQFVASVLEASRGEKLKFERAWIIRASKGARTLADVQRNVRKAMETAKGMSADVYLTLDAYLESVVPQIASVKWAKEIRLQPGVNVMDMTGLNVEMQHLVIKSALDWVLSREEHTVVVVPEAWKFIPQGRGTPVKLAAEAYIRQAAGLGNYLWLDSQDIAGVEKIILKSVPLWVLGVQREANEIKRTLDNIPASVAKPKAADVARLELGQFFACWSTKTVKTYVQPLWLSEAQARAVALGQNWMPTAAPEPEPVHRIEQLFSSDAIPAAAEPVEEEIDVKELEEISRKLDQLIGLMTPKAWPDPFDPPVGGQTGNTKEALVTHPALAASEPPLGTLYPADEDALYQRFKARLAKDAPALLKLLTAVPELHVEIERPVIELDGSTLKGKLGRMIADGLFDSVLSGSAATKELARRGTKTADPNVYRELDRLAAAGVLTKEQGGYQKAPGLKVVRKEK